MVAELPEKVLSVIIRSLLGPRLAIAPPRPPATLLINPLLLTITVEPDKICMPPPSLVTALLLKIASLTTTELFDHAAIPLSLPWLIVMPEILTSAPTIVNGR